MYFVSWSSIETEGFKVKKNGLEMLGPVTTSTLFN